MVKYMCKWVKKFTEAIFYDIEANFVITSFFIYFDGKAGGVF